MGPQESVSSPNNWPWVWKMDNPTKKGGLNFISWELLVCVPYLSLMNKRELSINMLLSTTSWLKRKLYVVRLGYFKALFWIYKLAWKYIFFPAFSIPRPWEKSRRIQVLGRNRTLCADSVTGKASIKDLPWNSHQCPEISVWGSQEHR